MSLTIEYVDIFFEGRAESSYIVTISARSQIYLYYQEHKCWLLRNGDSARDLN
jgi:hypothetical protein